MRCVSYTRSTSSQPMLVETQPESITQQNEEIQEFIKPRGWKIEKKYSDRRKDENEESAFLKMKEDGIAREFDCVVVSSLYYCGKGAILAIDLFELVFLPAGIHFAIVDDDVCSADMTMEEAKEYLNNKRKQVHSEKTSVFSRKNCEKRKYLKYGYQYKADSMELVIDNNVADNIREIFNLASNGKVCNEICHIMDEQGIKPAHVYMKQLYGKPLSLTEEGKWKEEEINNILKNKLYIGKWERTINGEKKVVDCPAIVDEDTFNKVHILRANRGYGIKSRGRKAGTATPFSKKIIDYDTGTPLIMLSYPKTKEKIFRMRYPKQINVQYEKMWIPYSEVENQVWIQVQREKLKAQIATEILCSAEGIEEKNRCRQILIEEDKKILEKMLELEKRRHLLRHQQEETHNPKYQDELSGLNEMFSSLDFKMLEVEEKIADIEKVFSEQNPWIKTFANLNIDQGITRELSHKCIDCVKCVKFENVVTEFKYSDWREKLPQEWFGGLL